MPAELTPHLDNSVREALILARHTRNRISTTSKGAAAALPSIAWMAPGKRERYIGLLERLAEGGGPNATFAIARLILVRQQLKTLPNPEV